jgi:hypothetical protein
MMMSWIWIVWGENLKILIQWDRFKFNLRTPSSRGSWDLGRASRLARYRAFCRRSGGLLGLQEHARATDR